MRVAGGAERAQECQVLLKLGQSRAISEGLMPLTRVSVLGSHGHISATLNVTTNAARFTGERVADLGSSHIMCPAAAQRQGRTARSEGLMVILSLVPRLTKRGEQAVESVVAAWRDADANVTKRFSTAKRRQLVDMLDEIGEAGAGENE